MCDNFFDDDGIDALEMALILAVTEEMEEESKTPLSDQQLTPEQMLETPNDYLDEE